LNVGFDLITREYPQDQGQGEDQGQGYINSHKGRVRLRSRKSHLATPMTRPSTRSDQQIDQV